MPGKSCHSDDYVEGCVGYSGIDIREQCGRLRPGIFESSPRGSDRGSQNQPECMFERSTIQLFNLRLRGIRTSVRFDRKIESLTRQTKKQEEELEKRTQELLDDNAQKVKHLLTQYSQSSGLNSPHVFIPK